MEDPPDSRQRSAASSVSSVSEYINTLYNESELESSSVNSVNVLWTASDHDKSNLVKNEQPLDTFGDQTEHGLQTEHAAKGKGFRMMYIAALAALMNAVAMGFACTYTATATDKMQQPGSSVKVEDSQVPWIGSLLAVGALVGGMAAGTLTSSFGRKTALLISSVPFTAGWLLIAYAPSVEYIYAGRLLTGFCCGLVSVTTPMYLIEISTPEVRGLLGASFQLFVVIGVLIVSCLGSVMTWTWLAIAGLISSIVALIAMIPVPESPRWLMTQGRPLEAVKAIRFLQGDHMDASEECKAIQDDINSQPKGSFELKEFSAPAVYKPAIFSLLLMFFQQFSGVNAIMFYTVSIFNSAGSSLGGTLATIIVAAVQVVATFLGSILMDRAGRKMLLLISGVCMAVSLSALGGFNLATSRDAATEKELRKRYGLLPLGSLMIFIAAFSVGFGPIPWLMVAEMTPARFRSAVSGVATGLNWFFVFIVTKTFHDMTDIVQDYGTYWIYAAFSAASCLFTYFLLPETKGRTLEEIQKHFTGSETKLENVSVEQSSEKV